MSSPRASVQVKKLWFEFEEWVEGQEVDYFNMQIELDDGRVYALNVWTFESAGQAYSECSNEPRFCLGPDLLVESVKREDLEKVVNALIADDALKEHWLVSK